MFFIKKVTLEKTINEWKHIVLFISHDETLIERTANMVIHIEQIKRKTSNGFLTSFTTEVKSSTGEIEKFNYAWKNINAGTGSTTED